MSPPYKPSGEDFDEDQSGSSDAEEPPSRSWARCCLPPTLCVAGLACCVAAVLGLNGAGAIGLRGWDAAPADREAPLSEEPLAASIQKVGPPPLLWNSFVEGSFDTRTPTWELNFSDLDGAETAVHVDPDVHAGPEEAAHATFSRFATHVQLEKEFTVVEAYRFRERFVQAMSSSTDSGDWVPRAQKALQETRPALTSTQVERINILATGWSAELTPRIANLTLSDENLLTGYREVDDGDDESGDDARASTLDSFNASDPSRAADVLPAVFDARAKWPHCQEAMSHVRDQGNCGSCWAQSAANTLDSQLCIGSGGEFSGPRAWISASYLASCYCDFPEGGCSGGDPGSALKKAASLGVPTGGTNKDTCVPYFTSGGALEHFFHPQGLEAPTCPSTCSQSRGYPRSLASDKFYPQVMVQRTYDLQLAKRYLFQTGPFPITFYVYKDFLAYKSGYYDVVDRTKVGGHTSTMIGWTQWHGADYILAINSWGTSWGEGGGFKMRADCCHIKYHVAIVRYTPQAALPLPAFKDRVDNCEQYTGGTCFLGRCDRSRGQVTCSYGRCKCKPHYCASHGLCQRKCVMDTGGTCHFQNCRGSRGATFCEAGRCLCKIGHCAMGGVCYRE